MTKRNEPCPCGSGKKYKKCCLQNKPVQVADYMRQKMRRTEGELTDILSRFSKKYYGQEGAEEALDEFFCWNEMPEDEHIEMELDGIFQSWFFYNWTPENPSEDFYEPSVALNYLEKKGQQVPAFTRRFIEAACDSEYSFYLVTNVAPGETITLKDLLLGTEVTVLEHQASLSLKPGVILFTRVITMDNTSLMLGGASTIIPMSYHAHLLDLREGLLIEHGQLDNSVLWERDFELRETYLEIRQQVLNPLPPQLVNTDGDPIQPTSLFYHLNCSPMFALDALKTLCLFETEEELFSNAEYDGQKQLCKIGFSWMKKGNQKHAGWDNTILGEITINGSELKVQVNSQKRADEIKQKILNRLGEQARYKTALIESAEKMMEEARANNTPRQPMEIPEEMRGVMAEMSKKHWIAWLDTPLPILKNQTPREASKTKIGKELLEGLLLDFENKGEIDDAMMPDISMLRETLGIDG